MLPAHATRTNIVSLNMCCNGHRVHLCDSLWYCLNNDIFIIVYHQRNPVIYLHYCSSFSADCQAIWGIFNIASYNKDSNLNDVKLLIIDYQRSYHPHTGELHQLWICCRVNRIWVLLLDFLHTRPRNISWEISEMLPIVCFFVRNNLKSKTCATWIFGSSFDIVVIVLAIVSCQVCLLEPLKHNCQPSITRRSD